MIKTFVLIVAFWDVCGFRSSMPCVRVHERAVYENAAQCEQARKGHELVESAKGTFVRESYACIEVNQKK